MKKEAFDLLAEKLEENVYGSHKGRIRLALLQKDIQDFWPDFTARKGLDILDAGGGAGYFARICARLGHSVLLCDISETMLAQAAEKNRAEGLEEGITLLHSDILKVPASVPPASFDLAALHGSAEWSEDPGEIIRTTASLIRPGGCLSLLIFNRDKLLFKRGINGTLVTNPPEREKRSNKLIPPHGLTCSEARKILDSLGGSIRIQSGIRIFQGFFRSWNPPEIPAEQWLQQEEAYYRTEPFNGLGEHTHFIWVRDGGER